MDEVKTIHVALPTFKGKNEIISNGRHGVPNSVNNCAKLRSQSCPQMPNGWTPN